MIRLGSVADLESPLLPLTLPSPVAGMGPPDMLARPHVMHVTNLSCASTVFVHRPLCKSQILIVLSSDAERRYLPDGWKTSARIQLSCPVYCTLGQPSPSLVRTTRASTRHGGLTKVRRHWPVWESHRRIDLSLDPVATNAPGDFELHSPPAFWIGSADVRAIRPRLLDTADLTCNPANSRIMG